MKNHKNHDLLVHFVSERERSVVMVLPCGSLDFLIEDGETWQAGLLCFLKWPSMKASVVNKAAACEIHADTEQNKN